MSNNNSTEPTANESLATRYSYSQLEAPYKGYADQVASLMRAYGDILAINDPAERKSAMEKVRGWVNGNMPTSDEVSKLTGPLGNAARSIGLGSAVDATSGTVNTIKGASDFVGAFKDGVMLPIDVAKGMFDWASDVGHEGFVRKLSEDQVREIGTAYGSVLQAQADLHGGVFGSMGDFIAHAKAAFNFVFNEYVKPLVNKVTGKPSEPSRSFDDYLQRAYVSTDMQAVKTEFAKLSSIGGVNGAELGQFLANGGQAQNAAGENVDVKPPSSETPVPTAPDAATNPDGSYAAADSDRVAAASEALNKANATFKDRVVQRVKEIDTPGEVAGAAVGAYATAATGHAVAQGVVRQHVQGPAKAAEAAAKEATKLREAANKASTAGKGWHVWENPQDTAARNAANVTKLETLAQTKEDQWLKHAEKAEARANAAGRFTQNALDSQPSRWNVVRNVGHWVGGKIGGTAESVANGVKGLAGHIPGIQTVGSLATRAGRVLGVGTLFVAPVVASAQTLQAQAEGDNAEVAIRGTEIAAVVGTAAKLGLSRSVPLAGPVVATADLASSFARDDARGMVKSGTALTTMGAGAAAGAAIGVWFGGVGAIPGALVGSLVGGIASIGTSWGAGKLYDRHHSAELLAKNSHDGAAGKADPGLQAAAVDANKPAASKQAQAQAAQLFLKSNVTHGGTIPEGMLSSPKFLVADPAARPIVVS